MNVTFFLEFHVISCNQFQQDDRHSSRKVTRICFGPNSQSIFTLIFPAFNKMNILSIIYVQQLSNENGFLFCK